jgi:hypothetical protein
MMPYSFITGCLAIAAGHACACGFVGASLAIPALVNSQSTKSQAAVTALLFHATASFDILRCGSYFVATGVAMPMALVWLCASVLNAAPWVLCPTPFAALLAAIPPFGFMASAHPFHAAGVWFPRTGLFGLSLTAFIPMFIARSRFATLSFSAIVVLLAVALPEKVPPTPVGWRGLNTELGDIRNNPQDLIDQVESMPLEATRVLVLSESAIPRWNDASRYYWQHVASTNRAILAGTTIADDANPHRYRNGVLLLPDERFIEQRVPVPIAMWNPFLTHSAYPNLTTQTIELVDDKRTLILVCYDQLLAWSYLPLAFHRAETIVGISNLHWVRNSRIDRVQLACMRSWSRLFDTSLVTAVNR